MARQTDADTTFRRHEKVVAAVDLPGVPAGTKGRIMLRNGFRWLRYRVRFDNGAEVAWVEGDQLAKRGTVPAAADG